MKIIIAGSRNLYPTHEQIQLAVKCSKLKITELVCGMAPGVDLEARDWAIAVGLPWKPFNADWHDFSRLPCVVRQNRFGRYNAMAGLNRNSEMAAYADGLIAIWDGESTGTVDMIRKMAKKPSVVYGMEALVCGT